MFFVACVMLCSSIEAQGCGEEVQRWSGVRDVQLGHAEDGVVQQVGEISKKWEEIIACPYSDKCPFANDWRAPHRSLLI